MKNIGKKQQNMKVRNKKLSKICVLPIAFLQGDVYNADIPNLIREEMEEYL